TGDEALSLMANLLEYHRREARPVWWWYFRRGEMMPDELVDDAEAIGQLAPDGSEPEKVARSLAHRFRRCVGRAREWVGRQRPSAASAAGARSSGRASPRVAPPSRRRARAGGRGQSLRFPRAKLSLFSCRARAMARASGGTSSVITDPAATHALSPIVTGAI